MVRRSILRVSSGISGAWPFGRITPPPLGGVLDQRPWVEGVKVEPDARPGVNRRRLWVSWAAWQLMRRASAPAAFRPPRSASSPGESVASPDHRHDARLSAPPLGRRCFCCARPWSPLPSAGWRSAASAMPWSTPDRPTTQGARLPTIGASSASAAWCSRARAATGAVGIVIIDGDTDSMCERPAALSALSARRGGWVEGKIKLACSSRPGHLKHAETTSPSEGGCHSGYRPRT